MIYLIYTVIIGIGATALMDLWAIVRKRLYGTALPNYGYVGRWIGHMRHGRFHHKAIANAAPIRGEHIIGWLFHYVTGISFAVLLIGVAGIEWMRHPTLGPAIAVGTLTVVAPFLVMQPAMGAGIAAAHTQRPGAARAQSLITHTVFGIGLYVSGWLMHLL